MSKPPIIPPLKSREEVESALGELALQENLAKANTARLEKIITRARSKYTPLIEAAEKSAAALRKRLEDWADKSPAEFKEKRSIDLSHGTLGYRLGQRELKPRTKITWAIILERLRRIKKLRKYVRWKPEVNKENILQDSEEPAAAEGKAPVPAKLQAADLEEMGVKVSQADNFYIDLKEA